MDFLKVRRFLKSRKPNIEKEQEQARSENNVPHVADSGKADEIEDDEDDDFITNEVKRRLKELRRNSFMVLIPEEDEEGEQEEEEESYLGEDEGEDKYLSVWRDVVAEGLQWWGGFDAVYENYCERMLFFDRLSSHQLKETGIGIAPSPSTPSPRSATTKLSSPFRCLSLKKIDLPEEEEDIEHLQQTEIDLPYQDLETAYVAQLCLTWEALHCQYTQLSHLISCQPETLTCYNHTAQQFQQFLVLLQRYIENEPFEKGLRAELYARARNAMPKLLQAPKIQGSDKEKDTVEFMVLADLIKIIESSILTFNVFMKMDKKKPNGIIIHMFGNNNHMINSSTTPLQFVQSSIEKKRVKAKELSKKTKGLRKKAWPQTWEGVQLLFAAIDIKLASRVVRMGKISKEQLLWCEEKMKKLNFSAGKLQRHPSPLLFPC